MKTFRSKFFAPVAVMLFAAASVSGASAFSPGDDPCTQCWNDYFACIQATGDRWTCGVQRDLCQWYVGCSNPLSSKIVNP